MACAPHGGQTSAAPRHVATWPSITRRYRDVEWGVLPGLHGGDSAVDPDHARRSGLQVQRHGHTFLDRARHANAAHDVEGRQRQRSEGACREDDHQSRDGASVVQRARNHAADAVFPFCPSRRAGGQDATWHSIDRGLRQPSHRRGRGTVPPPNGPLPKAALPHPLLATRHEPSALVSRRSTPSATKAPSRSR